MGTDLDEYVREGEKRQRRWARTGLIAGGVAVLIACGVGWYFVLNRVEAGDERVHQTLRSAGFRDATLGGAVTAACEEGESSRRFTATNATNERVEGTVCCGVTGVGKGCTIRWGR